MLKQRINPSRRDQGDKIKAYPRQCAPVRWDNVKPALLPCLFEDRYAFTWNMTSYQDNAVRSCKLFFQAKMDLTLHSPFISKSVPDTRLPEVVLTCLISWYVLEFTKHKRYNKTVWSLASLKMHCRPFHPSFLQPLSPVTTPSFPCLSSTFHFSNPLDRRAEDPVASGRKAGWEVN